MVKLEWNSALSLCNVVWVWVPRTVTLNLNQKRSFLSKTSKNEDKATILVDTISNSLVALARTDNMRGRGRQMLFLPLVCQTRFKKTESLVTMLCICVPVGCLLVHNIHKLYLVYALLAIGPQQSSPEPNVLSRVKTQSLSGFSSSNTSGTKSIPSLVANFGYLS